MRTGPSGNGLAGATFGYVAPAEQGLQQSQELMFLSSNLQEKRQE